MDFAWRKIEAGFGGGQDGFGRTLTYALDILRKYPLVSRALSSLFRTIYIDEYQDTQEIQYQILFEISRAKKNETNLFFVGDVNQAIYTSLGGVAKSRIEIEEELGCEIPTMELSGNYRSSQRIISFYRNFQVDDSPIQAFGKFSDETGLIVLNEEVEKENLDSHISKLISYYLSNGVMESDICVLAPSWRLVSPIGRRLKQLLPNVSFDASGLSPFRRNRENIWYRVVRLYLVTPSPNMYIIRLRWAKELIDELRFIAKGAMSDDYFSPKKILRLINSISPDEEDGLKNIEKFFYTFCSGIGVELNSNDYLMEHWNSFFDSAKSILASDDYTGIPVDIKSFKRMFRRREGVVVNTCHGVKGEEYDVVISYGLLKGMIPNWQVIINGSRNESVENSKRLLYVIASRAKRNLHFIAEKGRKTTTQNPYITTQELSNINFNYDGIIELQ